MSITLTNLQVWDTGEIIDVVLDTRTEGITVGSLPADGSVLDCTGLTLAPGFTDVHVHFRDPGQQEKETFVTGAKAAAHGGYTRVLVMPNTEPAVDAKPLDGHPVYGSGEQSSAVQQGLEQIRQAGCSDALEYAQTVEQRVGLLPVRYDMSVCASIARAGKCSVDAADIAPYLAGKIPANRSCASHPVRAISDDGSAITSPILDDVLAVCKELHLVCIDHCEHHETGVMNESETSSKLNLPGIAPDTELNIVARDIEAAERTGVHIHLQHISTALAVDAIREAKKRGVPVTCETAPHYIALDDTAVDTYGTRAKMNPPLRSKADVLAVRTGIADGTIDMIATDHAPHTVEEKNSGLLSAPNGIIGLESAYGVCHSMLVDTGIISEQRLIELMAVAPNRLIGTPVTDIAALLNTSSRCALRRTLDLRAVEHPELADMTIVDTCARWQIQADDFYSKARNTPFDGWQVSGRAVATIIGGQLVSNQISEQ